MARSPRRRSQHLAAEMAEGLDAALAHWARTTPDATAVRFGGKSFSYDGLNSAANSIAGTLAASGIAPGDRVGLHSAKGFYAIAAVFGVLRAGAVYVPIDTGAPAARVEKILADCGVSCLLVDQARNTARDDALPVIEIAEASATSVQFDTVGQAPEDLAYILYTSGSTGVPKGICHTHKSGMAYARMSAELCQLQPSDRVSHHTPLHFDMSIFDIFATAFVGATIVVIPEMHTKIPASLSQLVEDEGISVWYSVPFAMAQLVERGCLEPRDLSALRVVMFAGEVMPPRVLADFATHVPNARLLNAYGPTETNHCVTARIDRDSLDGVSALPIGHPDEAVTVAIDPSGELLVAGDQVMQGYWNDIARTEAVMVQGSNGAQFYKTGDIVERADDGQLMLLGRADRQVKLRGYRVELDEVERVLATAEGVREIAVAHQREDDTLSAFYSGTATPDALRQHGLDHLPPYMVPGLVRHLPALARTSTGKIDRHRLLELCDDRSAA